MLVIAAAFVFLLALGVPVVFVLGASAVLALVTTTDVPVAIVSQRVFAGLNSFTLMAIPFFVFAGVIMDAGGISRRLALQLLWRTWGCAYASRELEHERVAFLRWLPVPGVVAP